eukprot:gnl/TRDRNA2_/TRDRNA2_151793_c2_seq1.p2 gnl/TRDRNA2_/TRDRNA2_151793_c2~~gnl/TRDRNA2_/TRDRNA2_151793_c2_seq1.p2  ORF type:complete len:230 (+),score=53.86 gnl/TRDRNA2_/TRDRNA2_151793_c2_seq1:2-691(+)
MSQTTVRLIDDFLAWFDGIEGPPRSVEESRAIMCFSTNELEHLDPAVISRCMLVDVPLPGEKELLAWWQRHTHQLMQTEHKKLASLSVGMRLSFRDVKKLLNDQHDKAASKDMSIRTEMTFAKYEWTIKRFRGLCLGADCEPPVGPSASEEDDDSAHGDVDDSRELNVNALALLRDKLMPDLQNFKSQLEEVKRELQDERNARVRLEKEMKHLEDLIDEERWCTLDILD